MADKKPAPAKPDRMDEEPPDPGVLAQIMQWMEGQRQRMAGTAQRAMSTPLGGPVPMRFDAYGRTEPVYEPPPITEAMPPRRLIIPPVQTERLRRLGEAGMEKFPNWYGGAPEAFRDVYGERLAPLAHGIHAGLAQAMGPTDVANRANRTMRLMAEQGSERGLQAAPIMGGQKREIQKMLDLLKDNPLADLAEAFSVGSLKRRDYHGALGGRSVSAIDRHIGAPAMDPPDFFAKHTGDIRVYRTIQEGLDELADVKSLNRGYWQGSVWQEYRRLKGLLQDNKPFADILREAGERSPDYEILRKGGYLGKLPPKVVTVLAMLLPLANERVAREAEAAEPAPQARAREGVKPSRARRAD